MSRPPTLKSRQRDGKTYWYCEIDGRQYGLGSNYARAKSEFASRVLGSTPSDNRLTIGELIVLFDGWSSSHSSHGTRIDYMHWLIRIVKFVGSGRLALDIRPHDIDAFVARSELVGTWAHVKIVRSIKRLYRWASDQGHLRFERSPMTGLRKPPDPESPDAVYSRSQIWFLYRSCQSPFRDMLRFWRHTGARPEEPGKILRAWVNVDLWVVDIPVSHAKGRRRRRIVIPTRLRAMIRRRMKGRSAHLFVNSDGKPWTEPAIHSQFKRAMSRQPGLFPDGCKARIFRYTYATEKIKAGVDLMTIANLMGHSDLTMLKRHYEKVRTDLDYLRRAADI